MLFKSKEGLLIRAQGAWIRDDEVAAVTHFIEQHSATQFDDRFTAPIMGFRDAQDYYQTSSACQWLEHIQLPTLIINPANDPFLRGNCFPRDTASRMPNLYLEIPPNGGHCGFITQKNQEWWPARRIRQFVLETIRPQDKLPNLLIDQRDVE